MGAPHLFLPVMKLHTKKMLYTKGEIILEKSCVMIWNEG